MGVVLMSFRLGVLAGDGIGPEIVEATVHVLEAAQRHDSRLRFEWVGELAGSLGMAPSINAGIGRAMAQAAHGSAPDIAGRGIANPVGLVLSAAMLLDWLGGVRQHPAAGEAGQAIQRAVAATFARGPRTPDLGGTASTREFTEGILRHLGL